MNRSTTDNLGNPHIRFGFILFLGLIIRLIGITSRPIWYDEAFSILFSEKGFGQMLYGTLSQTSYGSADIHPLGYYTLLWIWMKLFGNSLISARLLSILGGMVSILFVYLIAFEFFDRTTAETSAAIMSLLPFQIHYAQEIRMYSILTMWLMIGTFCVLRGSRTQNWKWWAGFALASAFAQYTHNLAVFFLLPLSTIPLLKKDWKSFRSLVIAGICSIVLYLPWLMQLPSQLTKVNHAYWITRPDASRFFTLIIVYLANLPLPQNLILPALSVSLALIIIGLRQTIKANGTFLEKGLVLYLSFAMPILLFLVSQWKPIYIERALLPSAAFFCIWLGWVYKRSGFQTNERIFFTFLSGILFTTGIYQHLAFRGFPYGPSKEMSDYLSNSVQPGDLIVHSNKLSMLPTMYFQRGLDQIFIADLPGGSTDTLANATQEVLGITSVPDIQTATSNTNRVWYIIYQQSIDEYKSAGKYTHPDIIYLNDNFTILEQSEWDNVMIFLFTNLPSDGYNP